MFPKSIEAWLRKDGFKCDRVEDTKPSNAVVVVKSYRNLEWSKAILQKNGLLILRPTSASDSSLAGLFITGLTTDEPRAAAEALNHLMVTPVLSKLLGGIEAFPAGCLVEGLGTANPAFSSLR